MDTLTADASDLAAFADPYTEVKTRHNADGIRVEMLKNGRSIYYEIKTSDGRVVEGNRKHVYPSVSSLLSSERFANLPRLAETQLRAIASKQMANPIPSSIFMQGRAVSTAELSEFIGEQTSGKLRLMLLDGPAGVGKTFQIDLLVKSRATRLRAGEAVAPVLHVSSKGRRLSNLKDVLAASTQDLDASFFAKHIPILVRRGLLVVAIDGFDELVDADGYEDSWLALRQFITDVGEGGCVLLAARDTFVEEQELLTRIDRTNKQVALQIGQVMTPSPDQAREWLSASPTWKPAEFQSDVAGDILREGSYALRPFFLKELWNAKGWTDVVDVGPRTYLVNRLLGREASLIAQQIGGTTKDRIIGPLVALLEEVAIEMVSREGDFVEVEHLSFLTQFCFEGIVDQAAIRKLMHKSGSLALLELSHDKGTRRFPHSEIQHYFLGLSLLKSLESGVVPSFLRRHQLTVEEIDVFQEIFASDNTRAERAATACASFLAAEVSSDALAPNLSALMFLSLALGNISRLDFAETIEATFAGEAPVGIISSSRVSRLDACGADLSQLSFDAVNVGTLVVDDSTAFGVSAPDIGVLEIRSHAGDQIVRDRSRILDWIHERAQVGDESEDSPSVRLLEKVARRAVRHFYLRAAGDEDEGSVLLDDPLWPSVFKVLQNHSRVEVLRSKSMHGRPSALVRVKNPLALLDRKDRQTAKIIDAVAAIDENESSQKTKDKGLPKKTSHKGKGRASSRKGNVGN